MPSDATPQPADLFKGWTPMLAKSMDAEMPEGQGLIGGIVSTDTCDFDGEVIEQDGIDWAYFEQRGLLNYNHTNLTVGEPISITRKGGCTLLQGALYLHVAEGKRIYETAQGMRKSNAKRTYGFSIEGEVLARDPLDEKRITKCRIMNVSVCEHPKNPETAMVTLQKAAVRQMALFEPERPVSEPVTPNMDSELPISAPSATVPVELLADEQTEDEQAKAEQLHLQLVERRKASIKKNFPHATADEISCVIKALEGAPQQGEDTTMDRNSVIQMLTKVLGAEPSDDQINKAMGVEADPYAKAIEQLRKGLDREHAETIGAVTQSIASSAAKVDQIEKGFSDKIDALGAAQLQAFELMKAQNEAMAARYATIEKALAQPAEPRGVTGETAAIPSPHETVVQPGAGEVENYSTVMAKATAEMQTIIAVGKVTPRAQALTKAIGELDSGISPAHIAKSYNIR